MSASRQGFVSLVGAGPGDPELWTVRALTRVQQADLVLYDALIDAVALHGLTRAQCFCVGKRAGRATSTQARCRFGAFREKKAQPGESAILTRQSFRRCAAAKCRLRQVGATAS